LGKQTAKHRQTEALLQGILLTVVISGPSVHLVLLVHEVMLMVAGLLCLRIMHPLEDGVVAVHGIGDLER
jgi:hypothetical protein